MIGYSPKFPLEIDTELGAYAVTKTLKEVAKQNFMNPRAGRDLFAFY